ncbi:hydroxyethylthiazole kinase [Palleronia sp. LCG004]|uniref:hydroxyethylthiazole kinase n=1 Tax=Palleronia sp. LCG004 TaxID=3079304 RepID=UPI002941EF8B|nr:hydroxyethylthiazole kinase [Palleronia sp. LCG004]WOI57735.1 hydroxyethylthiazole kinase [Palleronia sp. LCG004]
MDTPSYHLGAMRDAAPLVQNITNYVAMNVMANVLLAAGASPAMVHARGEAAEFARIASALSINIGTLDDEWIECMAIAADAAREAGTPWVLDPVAVGATAMRREAGARLLALGPRVVRGNASEILALSGAEAAGRGADAADAVENAEDAARDLARRTGAVVIATGPVDFATDGSRIARIRNGHAMMPRVTVMGCSLTGLIAAFVAPADDAFEASVAALAHYGYAGEIAAREAKGPGSFQVAFLDALHAIDGPGLDAAARIERA